MVFITENFYLMHLLQSTQRDTTTDDETKQLKQRLVAPGQRQTVPSHTIAVIDQRDNTLNISKTIEPDKLDGSLAEYCFGVPSSLRAVNNELDMIPAMLSVPWSSFSGNHIRNNTIIICVQVDN